MHKKRNIKTNTYLQGLRPISNTIPRGLRGIMRKGGHNFSNVVDNWTKIVGKKISDSCYPLKINASKHIENGVLTLMVKHGKEIEIEYERMNIIDKINSFFGYKYLKAIKLNILNQINRDNKKLKTKKNLEKKFEINEIKNHDLKKNLQTLIKAYNEKTK